MTDTPQKCVEKFTSTLENILKDEICRYQVLDVDSPNIIIKLSLCDGRDFILKGLAYRYWLGVRTIKEFNAQQSIAARVADHFDLSIAPIQWPDKRYIIEDTNYAWLVRPLIKGQIKSSFTTDMAKNLGYHLSRLHGLCISKVNFKPFPKIEPGNIPLSPMIQNLVNSCNDSIVHNTFDTVVSHRDIHSGNLIWQSERDFMMIDWESAGQIDPFVELLGVALNAAGLACGGMDFELFSTVLKAYKNYKLHLPDVCEARWNLVFQSWLLWFVYCAQNNKIRQAKKAEQCILLLAHHLDSLKTIYQKLKAS